MAPRTVVRTVTLSLDTSAYASGDLLADTQEVPFAFDETDSAGILQSIEVIDKDDQGAAFDIYVLDANVSFGTENSTPSISDTNAESILPGMPIAVGTGDYKDLGGVKVAGLSTLALPVKSAVQSRSIYIAVVNGSGTPTYTASGIVIRLGILRD